MPKKKLTNPAQHINHFRSQNIEQNVNPVVSDIFSNGLVKGDQLALIQQDVRNYLMNTQAPFPI